MDTECGNTETEACHSQLWQALSRLDEGILQFQELYRMLVGQDQPPEPEKSTKEPTVTFAKVIGAAPGRIREARDELDGLRTAFKKLCLQGEQ